MGSNWKMRATGAALLSDCQQARAAVATAAAANAGQSFVGFRFRRVLICKELMTDDRQLLEQYTRERSESAFRELVARNIDLVYSAALRQVNGADSSRPDG